MNFFVALLAWIVIGALLVTGVVMATKGSLLFLGIGGVLFFLGFAKWGCASH